MSEEQKQESEVVTRETLAIGDVVEVPLRFQGAPAEKGHGVVVDVGTPLSDRTVYARVQGPLGYEVGHASLAALWQGWYEESHCTVIYRGTSALRVAREAAQLREERDLLATNLERLAVECASTERDLRARVAMLEQALAALPRASRFDEPALAQGSSDENVAWTRDPDDERRLRLAEELNAAQLVKLQQLDLELTHAKAQLAKKGQ